MKRRQFLKSLAVSGAAGLILPRTRLFGADAPGNKLNIALLGTWGRGEAHFNGIAKENVVALCDVNEKHHASAAVKFPKAKQYVDWRKCLDQKDLDAVVCCTADHTHSFIANWSMNRGKLDAELARRLAAIEYSPIAVVGFGYRSLADPLDGFGLLTTTATRLPILGVLWDSRIFPDRAPAGCKSVRVMVGGQRNPELVAQDEAGLIRTARAGLEKTMGLRQEPDVTYVKRWDRGIPSYAPGHMANVDEIFGRAGRIRGLYLNCNAYRGIAMNDCAKNSRQLAERIAAG